MFSIRPYGFIPSKDERVASTFLARGRPPRGTFPSSAPPPTMPKAELSTATKRRAQRRWRRSCMPGLQALNAYLCLGVFIASTTGRNANMAQHRRRRSH
uniref:Uncharacterized protein n=1 Tax=Oryza sativa subsp. japonica TaxID=39947 RepID=Q7XID0_ORYSJ|nr:hypothetical protein [Oryza sativa Japonica Group]BAD30367.1 hypothetical protein [Oryza sativa Japonica Group]